MELLSIVLVQRWRHGVVNNPNTYSHALESVLSVGLQLWQFFWRAGGDGLVVPFAERNGKVVDAKPCCVCSCAGVLVAH